MDQFANTAETLRHVADQHRKYGTTNVLAWVTAQGKWIDDSILYDLAKIGLIDRVFLGAWAYGASSNHAMPAAIVIGMWLDYVAFIVRYTNLSV